MWKEGKMFWPIQTCKAYILFYVLYKPYKVTKTGGSVVKELSGQPQRD